VREELLHIQAYLTACIDVPEDEVESQIAINPRALLEGARKELAALIASADSGMVYRHGVKTAIIGRPNVGKSSLLNRLLGEERAIVTAAPGTTRDTVEEKIAVHGVPFHLVDTAGIRETKDAVEAMGIERSRRAMEQADLTLIVIDVSAPVTKDDLRLVEITEGRPRILVANKCDLPGKATLSELPQPVVTISAKTGTGIERLHEAMATAALGGKAATTDAVLVTNERHKAALQQALAHVAAAERTLAEQAPEDFITIDLAAALGALGEITGESATEELLERIFTQFCIGK
jgi:tRNA modification GTPase